MRKTKEVRRLTDDEENMPKPIEMPSDGEDYDSNFEIQSSRDTFEKNKNKPRIQKENNKMNQSGVSNKSSQNVNVDGLRQKVTEQAQRLTSLEIYKQLCEQRIRQLVPNHPLPVTENDLKSVPSDSKGKNLVQFYTAIIQTKDEEIHILQRRLEGLELSTERNYLSKVEDFPDNIDKLSADKIRDIYNRLYSYSQELQQEKEMILDSLRAETLTNDEQRNYIEMLRQTIESAIIKHGMSAFLQSARNSHSGLLSKDSSNVDLVIDIAKIKAEGDKYRKELVMAQVLIGELKGEIEYLKKTNEDMTIKKEKIKENLESGIRELENAKSRVTNLETEKEDIIQNFDDLKKDHSKLLEELYNSGETVGKLECHTEDLNRKISELNAQLENKHAIENKLNEYKKSFEKLYQDFEKTTKDKSKVDLEINELKEEFKKLQLENIRCRSAIEEKENDLRNLMKESENLNRHNKKIERMYDEATEFLKEREKEIRKLEDQLTQTERNLSNAKLSVEELSKDFEDHKKGAERKYDSYEKNIRELNSIIKELKNNVSTLENEKQAIYEDYLVFKNETEKLEIEVRRLNGEINSKDRSLNKLNDQNENLFKDFKTIEEERDKLKEERENINSDLRFWKEKYDKDINTKIGEINALNRDNSVMLRNIDDLNKIRDSLSIEINRLENLMKEKEKEIKNLSESKEDLHRKVDRLNVDLQKQIQVNYEVNGLNHSLNQRVEEFGGDVQTLQEERENLEIQKKHLYGELEGLRKIEKETSMKNYNLNSNLTDAKVSISSINSLIKNFTTKFDILVEKSNLFSSHFIENVKVNTRIFNNNNQNTHSSIKDTFKIVEDWVRSSSNELEAFYETLNQAHDKLYENSDKIRHLEQKLRNGELSEEERAANERKLQMNLAELSEQIGTLKVERDNIEKQCEKMIKEIKLTRNENKKNVEEIQCLKEKLSNLISNNETMISDIREKDQMLTNASFQVEALEERIVILVKEKKYLETLLMRVAKSHPAREVNKIVNEIMNFNDTLAQLERDRIKIEDSIIQLDAGCRNENENKASKKEKGNLKALTFEYDAKINEKRNQIRSLENELRNIENTEKNANNTLYEYEAIIKSLRKELSDALEELRRVRSQNNNFNLEVNYRRKAEKSVDEEFPVFESQKIRNLNVNTSYKSTKNPVQYESVDMSLDKPEEDKSEIRYNSFDRENRSNNFSSGKIRVY
jgi:chromosome segregation ATPase